MTAPLTDQEKIADLERANESLKTELIVISNELADWKDKCLKLQAESLVDKRKIISLIDTDTQMNEEQRNRVEYIRKESERIYEEYSGRSDGIAKHIFTLGNFNRELLNLLAEQRQEIENLKAGIKI